MRVGLLYRISSGSSDSVYFGQTVRSLRQRWYSHKWHLSKGSHKNRHLQASWAKYGESAFTCQLIAGEVPIEVLASLEKVLILSAGDRALNHDKDPVTHQHSEETRRRISRALSGRTMSPEHRARLSKAKTGTKHTEAAKRRISEVTRGRRLTQETKDKIAKGHIGLLHSTESKARMRRAKVRPITCICLITGRRQVFASRQEALENGFAKRSVLKALKTGSIYMARRWV